MAVECPLSDDDATAAAAAAVGIGCCVRCGLLPRHFSRVVVSSAVAPPVQQTIETNGGISLIPGRPGRAAPRRSSVDSRRPAGEPAVLAERDRPTERQAARRAVISWPPPTTTTTTTWVGRAA